MKFSAAVFSLCLALPAWAWQPQKPIDVTINHAAGSANELIFRVLAADVEQRTGARFTLVHRLGAGGVVGSKFVTQQQADGYHVGMIMGESVAIQDKIHVPDTKIRTYTPADFTFVVALAQTQYAVITHRDDAVNTPADLLQSIASERSVWSAGGGSRLTYETIKTRADKRNTMSWVNSIGPVQAVLDAAGRHVRFAVVPSVIARQYMAEGKIKIIAFTGSRPVAAMPQIPLMSSVLPGFDIVVTFGILAPRNLDETARQWYVSEFVRAARSPGVQKFYEKNLIQVPEKLLTTQGFTQYVNDLDRDKQSLVDTILASSPKK